MEFDISCKLHTISATNKKNISKKKYLLNFYPACSALDFRAQLFKTNDVIS